jgi:hypothetical protein
MRPRRTTGRGRRLTPGLVVVLVVGFLAVWLERSGSLPGPVAEVVRQAETAVLDPILRELGLGGPEVPPVEPGDGFDPGQARAQLARIRVEPERKRGYAREDWPHWLDEDRNCLDTRGEVLAAESLEPPRLGPDGCRVVAGRWLDRYTGETVTDPGALDVDHVVALEEAHGSGGHAWTRERRAAFANDLTDPRSLIAVSAAANRAKGAQGPEAWLPPDRRDRCRYVADWIGVKARWDLAMDESERVAVGNLVEACAAALETTASTRPAPGP